MKKRQVQDTYTPEHLPRSFTIGEDALCQSCGKCRLAEAEYQSGRPARLARGGSAMGDEVKVIAAPRGGWLKGLMLFVLTVCAVIMAADRINEAVIRWRYEWFLAENASLNDLYHRLRNDTPEFKERNDFIHEYWDKHAKSFRSRGFRHPKEWN